MCEINDNQNGSVKRQRTLDRGGARVNLPRESMSSQPSSNFVLIYLREANIASED